MRTQYVVFGLPFQIFVMRGFFRTVPSELLEAARLDGASELGNFWRILMPLSAPALATLFIIDALATWNELLIALVLISANEPRTGSWCRRYSAVCPRASGCQASMPIPFSWQ